MDEILFRQISEILELQSKLIDLFGGIHGIRDENAFRSAFAAAENRHYYENAPLHILAATFAFHLSQAHAFLDGNKRIAAAALGVFLKMNNAKLAPDNVQIIQLFLDIAASRLSREDVEEKFAGWIKES